MKSIIVGYLAISGFIMINSMAGVLVIILNGKGGIAHIRYLEAGHFSRNW